MKRMLVLAAIVALLCPSVVVAGGQAENSVPPGGIGGTITVLHQRTDMTAEFEEYARRFNQAYPNVRVQFESMTDYQGIVRIRMNTKDYGDVLLIPDGVTPQQLGRFFEPLGTVEELGQKYLGVTEQAYEGTVYGLPINVNAAGIVYNTRIFQEAGITQLPSSPDEFLEALRQIQTQTDAIPYYTNYASGWALTQWEAQRTSVAGDPNFVAGLARTDAPFAPGQPHYVVYKLLYDIVAEGLAEVDPTTSDWESSKARLASGEIATMTLGSWAISQIKAFAENPDDVGYMPFPYSRDGVVYAGIGGDFKIAVNTNSPNKEAALAWLWWFVNESGYALSQGGISPLRGAPMPKSLQAFQDLGVVFVTDNPSPPGEEGWVTEIDQAGEVGLWLNDFKARIVEAAFGARAESFDDIMADLNRRWAAGRAAVVP